jgi:hypothetical protein
MKGKLVVSLVLLLTLLAGARVFAQDDPTGFEARKKNFWQDFNKAKWHQFDFAAKKLTKAQLAKLARKDTDEYSDFSRLELLRGVVFGKRGRVFKERSIQDYLEKQAWYKPDKNFSNSSLSATERANLDLIRLAEAAEHYYVKPGDLRYWEGKLIPEDKMPYEGGITRAEWDVLIAEFEAIHGKTFPENEWLQKYFDERYWYKRNPNYTPAVLSATDRQNMQAFIDARNKLRKVAISPGDMDKFQTVPLREEQLHGLTLNELRIMRNEFFARRGRRFSTPGYRAFYEWQDWYKPLKDQSKVKLGATEEANVKIIEAYERKIREKLSNEPISEEMLEGLFVEDLRVLRNEIFARRGYVFKDKELQKTFENMDWYRPDPTFTSDKIATVLSDIEFKNVAAIKKAEEVAVSKLTEVEG